ncbi:MAG: hypothetical protein M0R02_12480 [Bacteroidales bacterium]|jgi:hypothetical protein|nr:hypothetical protein [Bacteroidales bacterium]
MTERTIRLLKHTVCGGKPVGPGEVVDASHRDASYLVATGAAEYCEGKAKPAVKRSNKMVDVADLTTREGD